MHLDFVLLAQVAPVRRAPLRVQNLRVNNVEIPNSKRIEISLQYIFGIGSTTAKNILIATVRAPAAVNFRQGSASWSWERRGRQVNGEGQGRSGLHRAGGGHGRLWCTQEADPPCTMMGVCSCRVWRTRRPMS